jgi:hypothetical protein
MSDRMETIRRLCSFERRWAGTDAERRAANDLAAQLRERGRKVEVEPTNVHPEYGVNHAFHLTIAVAGSLIAIFSPAVGFALVLVVAFSLFGDITTRFYLFRRLFFRRASQNVVSPGSSPGAPARVILCAHYDAAKTGMVFGPKSVERARRLSPRSRMLLGPYRVIFWSVALLLPMLGARMAGAHPPALAFVQLIPTVLLMLAIVALLDIALSEVVPGANDNASGVATALSVLDELQGEPPEGLDVWLLLTGGEECLAEGMRAFVRRHSGDLDRDTTYFVVIDSVGFGGVRWEVAEGMVVTYELDPRLAELCEAIAAADRDGAKRYDARPIAHPFMTDAMPPRLARYATTTITCLDDDGLGPPWYHTLEDTPDRIDPRSLEHAHGFTVELVRQLDREARRLSPAPPE